MFTACTYFVVYPKNYMFVPSHQNAGKFIIAQRCGKVQIFTANNYKRKLHLRTSYCLSFFNDAISSLNAILKKLTKSRLTSGTFLLPLCSQFFVLLSAVKICKHLASSEAERPLTKDSVLHGVGFHYHSYRPIHFNILHPAIQIVEGNCSQRAMNSAISE
jgi:hypothetical protein